MPLLARQASAQAGAMPILRALPYSGGGSGGFSFVPR
jgi:hypothetical protein